ncbi:hypothetical protein PCANC_04272 [Puccinia coronata f. sp. avenae]|uniref:CCHC-type domain-containing protein n=1 Tax=Puccinia coronata f. sp. avenae TaxID=200324 RepID=A0A2N5VUM7_9BASI|nr:hypothetical protein PCANC_04272 [Puccinia coronata f. sp. avenae]
MDAAINNGEVHAADNAARDEVINNLQHQVQQLLASNANKQAQIQQLVANALNPPPQAQRPEAAPKIETIPIRLPDFNGRGDVDIWIKKVECVLSGRNYHKDRWTSMIVTNLKDFSEAFWFNLVSELRVDNMPWPIFKQKLMYQFNYAHKQYDAWLELQFLKYTTANDYINKFKHTSIKLPSSKMSDNNKKFLFTVNLPGHLRVKVLSDKCNTLDNLFQSLQEHDCLEKRSFYQGTSGSGTYNNNHQSFVPHNHHRRSLSSNFPFTPKALVSQAVPMDLDSMDVSKARCYNCNKIGHLSKDSPAPRKIQYANSKMPDKNRQKNNLNLIDLDIPEETKSSSNIFFMEPIDPLVDLWLSTANKLKQIEDNLTKRFDKSIAKINQLLWNQVEREAKSHDLRAGAARLPNQACKPPHALPRMPHAYKWREDGRLGVRPRRTGMLAMHACLEGVQALHALRTGVQGWHACLARLT